MPSQSKMTRIKTRARAPKGKRQVLIIMDQDVIKSVKVAAVEDDIKMSHAVEEAVRDWLSKRKRERAASPRVIAAARQGGFEFVSCASWEIR